MCSSLRPADDASPASWLQGRVGLDASWVSSTVGEGFAAYARLFHPLDDDSGALRWADVAANNHRVMHPAAEWENISRPAGSMIPDQPTGRGYPGEPFTGTLFSVFLAPLCEVLAVHTNTPDLCWFGVWDGWGQMKSDVATVPSFSLPDRRYLLYRGAIGDALQQTSVDEQSPSLFWPDDHAWCVATAIDFDTTLIGGTQSLVDALVRSPKIEALQIDVDASFGDQVNT